jgi:ABC-type phosphate transport system substrate-binding protein
MQLRRRQQVVTVGGAVVAMALGLAACSSSSTTPAASSSTPAGSGSSPASTPASSAAAASGTIEAAGSTFQLNFQQAAISAFKSVDPGITVDYSGVGSGTGRADLYKNTVFFAGSDSPIPSKEASEVPAGSTVLYFPVLQPVVGHRPQAERGRSRADLPGRDHELEQPGDRGAQPGRQAAQRDDHARGPR